MHTSCKRRPGGWVLDPNLVKKNLIIHGQSAIHSKAHNVFWNMAHPSNLSSRSFPDPSFRPLSFVYFLINLDIKVMKAIWLWIFLGKTIQKEFLRQYFAHSKYNLELCDIYKTGSYILSRLFIFVLHWMHHSIFFCLIFMFPYSLLLVCI